MTEPRTLERLIVENFVWNKPFDPSLFRLEVPEGFKVVEDAPPTPTADK
jgi:hypothetical protein